MKKTILLLFVITVILFAAHSCTPKNEIESINHSNINGALKYHSIDGTEKPVPAGARVTVSLIDDLAPLTTFVTTSDGKFSYNTMSKGKYSLMFSFTDTTLRYDAALVQKTDIDTTRPSNKVAISYSNFKPLVVDVSESDNSSKQDITLTSTETGVKLLVTDDQNNPVIGARVCLYSNKTFAEQNAPYCGGCLAYLASDNQGVVYFTGLTAQAYYINARASIGKVNLTNQYAAEMRTVTVASVGQFTTKNIILK